MSCAYAADGQVNTNFSDLSKEISHTNYNSNLTLSKNYIQSSNENNVQISKSIVINGNNHYIKSNEKAYIFNVKDNINVTFKNITFYTNKYLTVKFNSGNVKSNVTFKDCKYKLNVASIYPKDPKNYYSCKVTKKIKKLAYSIIGKSKGEAAAKKLARWVHKNIKFEKKEGFYQSPTKTLKRKKANCCGQSELFLQMCEAVGLTKKHKVSFIHVGKYKYKKRHFFVTFDNLCVDVTLKHYWGHGSFSKGHVFLTSKYPMLPIKKSYK